MESWKIGKFGKHACAVATPRGCTDGHGNKDSSAEVSSGGAGFFTSRWLLCAPHLANEVCSRIYRHLLRWYRNLLYQGFLWAPKPKICSKCSRHNISYRRRSIKDRIVTVVSLTRVLVSCVVGVWLGCISVVLTTVRKGTTPHSKENKQADAGNRLFSICATRCCGIVRQQSVKVYSTYICTTGMFSRAVYAQHPVSSRIFASLPGSRL